MKKKWCHRRLIIFWLKYFAKIFFLKFSYIEPYCVSDLETLATFAPQIFCRLPSLLLLITYSFFLDQVLPQLQLHTITGNTCKSKLHFYLGRNSQGNCLWFQVWGRRWCLALRDLSRTPPCSTSGSSARTRRTSMTTASWFS